MKNKFYFLAFLLGSCFFYTSAKAYVRLPDIFSDNMVLQQQSVIDFYGWANPGQKITLIASWNGDTLSTVTKSNARWNFALATPEAGGSFEITVIADKTITIHNILIGEVWLCSGQSNMEFSANWHFTDYQQEIKNANHPEIRFFHIQRITAPYPQQEVSGRWEICTPESMQSFSSAGYFFGRTLNEKLHYPVGLIESAWGGTPVETWMPEEIFKRNENLALSARELTPSNGWSVRPAVTYNAMIAPLIDFDIAGVIWYQGESNVQNATNYKEAFSKMIYAWRNSWKKEFPFYFVQIAPFSYGNNFDGALLKEAQFQTLKSVPKTGMVVTTDITGDTNDIHPKNKQDVGKRLALWALANTYKQTDIHFSGPLYRSLKIVGNKAVVEFDYAKEGLMKKRDQLTDFFIAGEDRIFFRATATIKDSTVIVSSPEVSRPVAVRMGFSNTAIPDLFNKAGLPASPFRTDNWDLKKEE